MAVVAVAAVVAAPGVSASAVVIIAIFPGIFPHRLVTRAITSSSFPTLFFFVIFPRLRERNVRATRDRRDPGRCVDPFSDMGHNEEQPKERKGK